MNIDLTGFGLRIKSNGDEYDFGFWIADLKMGSLYEVSFLLLNKRLEV